VLEENPKWVLVADMLEEIRQNLRAKQAAGEKEKQGRVLIVCREDSSCHQLSAYLEQGGQGLLRSRFRQFLYRFHYFSLTPQHLISFNTKCISL
jgi:DNA excision repair protein ERCC-4